MPHRPSLDPPPRMKRWLALTVQNERGLNEGEGWWMDSSFIVVVCPEQFAPGDALEIRIDLGGASGSVDTHAVVIEHNPHRTRRGYVHSAQWLAHSQDDRDRVLQVIADLKDEAAPTPVAAADAVEDTSDSATFDFPTDPGPVAVPPPTRQPAATRIPESAQPPARHPPPVRPAARPTPPAARPARSTPPASAALADDLHPQFAPGDPPSIYVAVDSVGQLARMLTIIDHHLRLVLPRIKGLSEDLALTVALRMPSGMFIQFEARVERMRRRDVVIDGVDVPADTRMVLHELLEQAAR